MNSKTALVIVDVQMAMFEPANPVVDADIVLERLKSLIQTARKTGVPVIFVQHNEPGSEFDPGSDTWKIHPEIAPAVNELVIQKFEGDAFAKTDFDQRLKERGIADLIVAGMQSEYCINTNARAARELGYKVTVVSDAHSTFNSESESGHAIISRINEGLTPLLRLAQAREVFRS